MRYRFSIYLMIIACFVSACRGDADQVSQQSDFDGMTAEQCINDYKCAEFAFSTLALTGGQITKHEAPINYTIVHPRKPYEGWDDMSEAPFYKQVRGSFDELAKYVSVPMAYQVEDVNIGIIFSTDFHGDYFSKYRDYLQRISPNPDLEDKFFDRRRDSSKNTMVARNLLSDDRTIVGGYLLSTYSQENVKALINQGALEVLGLRGELKGWPLTAKNGVEGSEITELDKFLLVLIYNDQITSGAFIKDIKGQFEKIYQESLSKYKAIKASGSAE